MRKFGLFTNLAQTVKLGLAILCAYTVGAFVVHQIRAARLDAYESRQATWWGEKDSRYEAVNARWRASEYGTPEYDRLFDEIGAILGESYNVEPEPTEPMHLLIELGGVLVVVYVGLASTLSLLASSKEPQH